MRPLLDLHVQGESRKNLRMAGNLQMKGISF